MFSQNKKQFKLEQNAYIYEDNPRRRWKDYLG